MISECENNIENKLKSTILRGIINKKIYILPKNDLHKC